MFFLKPNIEKMEEAGDIKGLLKALKNPKDVNTQLKVFCAINRIGNGAFLEFIADALNSFLIH